MINNKWVNSISKETFPVYNPATQEEICQVSRAKKADVDLAVAAAKATYNDSEWSRYNPADRRNLLLKVADNMEQNFRELSTIESHDNGKSVALADFDINLSINVFRFYAGLAERAYGKRMPTTNNTVAYSKIHPVGVCGQIVPWNFPMLMAAFKIAPVLASGCTTILKPAEGTPLSALRFGQMMIDSGMPAGVVNILPGYGNEAGQAIVEHPDVNKIAFTGSVSVGKHINRTATETLKRVHLELGGKSPHIVLDDANLDSAVANCNIGCFLNSGQFCLAGTRIFVQEGIYDEFIKRAIVFS